MPQTRTTKSLDWAELRQPRLHVAKDVPNASQKLINVFNVNN
jgi:hypothetical protein